MKITTFFQSKTEGSENNEKRKPKDSVDDDSNKKQRIDEVDELLRYLTDDNPNGWKAAISKYTSTPSFARLAKFVSNERKTRIVYPEPQHTWSALNACSIDKIKVVIVGQDPYHGPNQAHGLSFSVLPGQPAPPSLKNIFKELSDDPDVDFPCIPSHGNLSKWAYQGVLMLNNVLTVRKGEANSHKKQGWEELTDELIRIIDRRCEKVVFLLWGVPAVKKAMTILGKNGKKETKHTIITCSHPSPLGARQTDTPFLGSRCFSRCNSALIQSGRDPIDWKL